MALLILTLSGGATAPSAATPDSGAAVIAAPVDAGYRDFSFGPGTLATPTGEKPQSKLWWNDGVWWGCLWDPAAAAHRIHRFDPVAHTWASVGPNADNRANTLVDVLWDGNHLYIVSHIFDSSGEFRLHSYTYDAALDTYTLRGSFPVVMGAGSAEALTIAKDTTGKLWVSWEQGGDIIVNRSTSSETTWGTAFRLPVQGNDTSSDDIAGIVAFGNQVGILWSNQADEKMYFAPHLDGTADSTWQPREEALANAMLGDVADDHLNMALSYSTNPPCLFAVTKTSLSGASTLPEIYLLRRDPAGTWTSYVAGDQDDDHTRAIVQIDDENRKIYIIARSNVGDNAIRMKVSDLDTISFADGAGTAFIQSLSNPEINNPSGTKQTLNGTTNLLVVASDEISRYYFHNTIDLPSTPKPEITVSPAAHDYGNVLVGNSSSRTFQVRNDGNANLKVTSTTLTGTNPTQFAVTSGGGTFVLSPGATRNVVVAFKPTTLGAKSSTLRFASNDPDENPLDVPLTGTGVQPDIAVDPPAHDYGNIVVGTTVWRSFQAQNVGSSTLNVSTTALTGTHPALFSVTAGGGPFALAPGATQDIVVAFSPTSTGRKDAILRLTSDDLDENPLDVALSGAGVQPEIAVSPMAHDFGALRVGVTAAKEFIVRNQGADTLHVGAPALSGPDIAPFTIVAGGDGFALAPADSHSVTVSFTPDRSGTRSAVLSFTSDAPVGDSVDVALAGTGVLPDIAVSRPALVFGHILVGTAASETLEIRNGGTGSLAVTAQDVIGADAGDFAITQGAGAFSIATGDSHLVTITFTPQTLGRRVATLRFTSDDPDENPLDIDLSGDGVQPDIALQPTSYDYGAVLLGDTAAHAFTVHNLGTAVLAVSSTTFLGTDAGDFAVTGGAASFSVAPGDSHQIVVRFDPAAIGTRSAVLRIASNDPDDNPIDIGLSGNGVQPDIAVTPAAHDFGAVAVGDSVARSFTVRNEGSTNLSVISSRLLGMDANEFAISSGAAPFNVAAGDSQVIVVFFLPGSTGRKAARLQLQSNDSDDSPLNLSLDGIGVEAAADITVTPGTYDFGLVLLGTDSTHTFTVLNTGLEVLNLTATGVLGLDAADFVITSGGGAAALATGDSLQLALRFSPTMGGARAATLRFESDDPDESVVEIALAGCGITPEITVQPRFHVFPTVVVGDSAVQQFSVRNDGTAALHVKSLWLAGPDSTSFALMEAGSLTVAPGDSSAVGVLFAPATAGSHAARMRLESDDLDETLVAVDLGGSAVPRHEPDLEAPSTCLFGSVALGTVDSLAIILENTGTSDLHLLSSLVVGPDSLDFVLVTSGALELPPSTTSAIVIAFGPSVLGARHAVLRIVSDDPDESPWNIALQGTGGTPYLLVTPESHDFGSMALASTAAQLFRLSNQGTIVLEVNSTTLSGTNAAEFAITSGGGQCSLLPGSSHDVVVSFLPATVGRKSAVLEVASNDPTTPSTAIALSGSGATAPVGGQTPTYAESASGSAANAVSVSTTTGVTAASGQLYLAVVSTHPLVAVTTVDGMELTWSRIRAQCGANQTTGIEVWIGQGNAVPGVISATFDRAPASAVILVSRYTGTDPVVPIAALRSANTQGNSGTCTGGTDSAIYSMPLATSADDAVVFAAVATGRGILTPGTGWTPRGGLQAGGSAAACGVAVLDQPVLAQGSLFVDGAFDNPIDWAVVALELRGVDATTDAPMEPAAAGPARASLCLHDSPGGQPAHIEITLPHTTAVGLTLHDVRGKRLRTLWHGILPAGRHELAGVDAARTPGLAAGIYFVRADLGGQVLSRKLVVVH